MTFNSVFENSITIIKSIKEAVTLKHTKNDYENNKYNSLVKNYVR